jgi:transketolase
MKKQFATRDAYGKTLVSLKDPNVVVLDADLSGSTRTSMFADKHPERFFNIGISEANMMGIAAGLATCGKNVFVSTFGVFATTRALDQIRQSICYNDLDVKICATHCGLTVGEDGATHQAIEDISIMRTLANMKVFVPADAHEAGQVIQFLEKHKGPAYVRLGRNKYFNMHENPRLRHRRYYNTRFKFGKAQILKQGNEATIIACGYMVTKALMAAEKLAHENIHVTVLNMSTIKPIDKMAIMKCPKPILTVEEGLVNGGLGSAVAEVLCEDFIDFSKKPMLKRMGVYNEFAESGKPEELLKKYGLTHTDIVAEMKNLLL